MTTVRELVFGDAAGEVQAAEKLAHDVSISRAVVSKVSEALNFEVSDVLVWGWRTRSALLDAARETHGRPRAMRRVVLKSYAVPWDYEMRLDILVNGARATTMTFVLTLSLEVTALAAVVQNGFLTKIDGGRYRVEAVLKAEGTALVRREHEFDLTYELKIGNGIGLISGSG